MADLYFQLRSHAYLFEAENDDEEEEARMETWTAVGSLLVVTVITSFCADFRELLVALTTSSPGHELNFLVCLPQLLARSTSLQTTLAFRKLLSV